MANLPSITILSGKAKSIIYFTDSDNTNNTAEHRQLVNKVIDAFHYQSDLQYTTDGRNTYQIHLTEDKPTVNGLQMLDVNKDYQKDYFELPHTTASSGYTHDYFKEILEGYSESNTRGSLDNFINPYNQKLYTYANMQDGDYAIKAWLEDISLTNYGYNGLYVKGKEPGEPLDQIVVKVKGSMYEDLDN